MSSRTYNTKIYEVSPQEEMDDYIVFTLVLSENRSLAGKKSVILPENPGGQTFTFKEHQIKVYRNGLLRNLDDTEISTKSDNHGNLLILPDGKDVKSRLNSRLVGEIIWQTFGRRYGQIREIHIGELSAGLIHKDGNKSNNSADNLLYRELTSEGTEVFECQSYFEDAAFIRDEDPFILNSDEPVILEEFPELDIYKNGNVVDRTGRRSVRIGKGGYQYMLYNKKTVFVHRLVAKAYLKNNEHHPFVNHIDSNRSNNEVTNLEWVNNRFNILHGLLNRKSGLGIRGHERVIYDLKFAGCLTSRSYRNFIRKKIHEELDMEPDFWIFSNSEPIFLLYLPFMKSHNDFRYRSLVDSEKNIFFRILHNQIQDCDFKQQNSRVIEIVQRFYEPRDKSDHVVNLLKELGIDFEDFFNWLFDDLKYLVGDDVGFIYFREFRDYLSVIQSSQDVIYLNRVLEISHVSRNKNFRPKFRDGIFKSFRPLSFDRVVEEVDHHGFRDKAAEEINSYIRNSIFVNRD